MVASIFGRLPKELREAATVARTAMFADFSASGFAAKAAMCEAMVSSPCSTSTRNGKWWIRSLTVRISSP